MFWFFSSITHILLLYLLGGSSLGFSYYEIILTKSVLFIRIVKDISIIVFIGTSLIKSSIFLITQPILLRYMSSRLLLKYLIILLLLLQMYLILLPHQFIRLILLSRIFLRWPKWTIVSNHRTFYLSLLWFILLLVLVLNFIIFLSSTYWHFFTTHIHILWSVIVI